MAGRSTGLLLVLSIVLCLSSCDGTGSNGIFNLNSGSAENWVGHLKYSFKVEYPMLPVVPGAAREFPDFKKSEDITVWAIYYDGTSQIIPNVDLSVVVNGEQITGDPVKLNFIGKSSVNVTYRQWNFSYEIFVGVSSDGTSDPDGDGTGVNIVITY
jgi:hypothetical protein